MTKHGAMGGKNNKIIDNRKAMRFAVLFGRPSMYTTPGYATTTAVDRLRYHIPSTKLVTWSRTFSVATTNHATKPIRDAEGKIQAKTQLKPEPYISDAQRTAKSITQNTAQVLPQSERIEQPTTGAGDGRLPAKYKPAARQYEGLRCEIDGLDANACSESRLSW